MTEYFKQYTFISCICAITALPVQSVTPPTMGWSSWNTFALNINEQVIKEQADAMVKTGLSDVGYKYVNIDDGYWDGRGEDGRLRLNRRLFPKGMRHLTDYIHSLGLKAGIYSDAGDNTCGSNGGKNAWGKGVGFAGHDQEDCNLYFNEWNFDFIKVDYCGGMHLKLDVQKRYTEIANAIRATRRPDAQYNLCRWAFPGTWASGISNSWRTTGDIYCDWKSVKDIILRNRYLSAYAGGGSYNDMDMLEIGRTLSHDEEITHMVMWCQLSSPLLIGCDLTKISDFSLNLLMNKELIAVNQDVLGLSAPIVQKEGEVYVYAKDLKTINGPLRSVAVCNLSDQNQRISVSLASVGYEGSVKVRDAVARKDLPTATGSLQIDIPAHGSRMLILNGTQRKERNSYEAEEAWLKDYNAIGKPGPTYVDSPATSMGAYVGFIGNKQSNYLQWNNVYSQQGGKYKMIIHYLSAEDRSIRVAVNGIFVNEMTHLNSGSWHHQTSSCSLEIQLEKGINTIKLSNPAEWMPNIDRMELVKI